MPIFLFHGDDTYSIKRKADFWKEEFAKKHGGDTNLEIIEGKNLAPENFRSAVTTMPFLGEKRLVIIKNLLSEGDPEIQKKIAEMLSEIPDFCVLLLCEEKPVDQRVSLFKRIQKTGKTEEFPEMSGGALLSWIFKICKKFNVEIDEEAAIFLSELVGGNLYRLENEIHKLAHYLGESKRPILKKDIELLVDTTLDTSVFRLTDALAGKNPKASLSLLHQLLDSGEDLHRILYMIIRQFRLILQVKDLLNQGQRKHSIAAKMKEKPFVVSIAMGQSSNFSFEKLKEIYERLLKIDIKIKTGGIKITSGDSREFLLEVDKFILDCCRN